MDRIDDVATNGLAPPDQEPLAIAPADATPQDVVPAELDEQTRARLLRAAVCVFDRKGYAAASVREIVEIAGVTKPALYYHFGSKEGVLTAVLQEAAREFVSAMKRGIDRPGTARERLFAICADLHGLFREHVPVVRVAHCGVLRSGGGHTAVRLHHVRSRDGTHGPADRRGRPGDPARSPRRPRLRTSRSSSSASSGSSPPGTCTAGWSPSIWTA